MYFTGSAHFNRSMRNLAGKMNMSLSEHSLNEKVVRVVSSFIMWIVCINFKDIYLSLTFIMLINREGRKWTREFPYLRRRKNLCLNIWDSSTGPRRSEITKDSCAFLGFMRSFLSCKISCGVCGNVITARVRSTREGTVFTGVCLSTFRGGVPPCSQLGGYPFQLMGGIPIYLRGNTKSSWWGAPPLSGVPPSGQREGVPHLVNRGYPHPANGGTPIGIGWGHPPPSGLDGGTPPQLGDWGTEQLRGGRYASCIHVGGLSCLVLFLWLKCDFLSVI